MEVRRFPSSRHAARDLTRAPEFRLGALTVDPPSRRICTGGRSEMLEPRVMRVLVALAGSPGKVLSRDDLIELCWDGVIVGDNAIDRVMSRLRKLLSELSSGDVQIETIPRVGFRLDAKTPSEARVTQEPIGAATRPELHGRFTRRAIAGGLLVLGTSSAIAYAALHGPARPSPDPRALDLYKRGQLTQKTSLPGSMRQAMSFYQQAVTIDPGYADAWAALAIGYRHGGDGFVKEPRSAYPRLVRSAAQRALAIDPDNAEAHLALAVIESDFGRWLDHEQRLRDLVHRFPDYWFSYAQLDLLLQNVGRFEEGIVFRRRMLQLEPTAPAGWAYLARGLHYAGRDHEASIALDQALSRWPAHPLLWPMQFSILIGGKRYTEAAAFARDPRHLPEIFPGEMAQAQARIADALASQKGLEQVVAIIRKRPLMLDLVPMTLPIIAELGAIDLTFDVLSAYFFGGTLNGQNFPRPEAADARVSAVLFAPPVIAFRGDPRFRELLKRTGLEDYWHQSGSRPDFRTAKVFGPDD